jgi:MFS family permease
VTEFSDRTGPIELPDEQQLAGDDSDKRSVWLDLSPLKQSPAFARLWGGSAIALIGSQMTVVAVGLHVYEITQSTFAVAMLGLVSLVPMIIAGLYGGTVIDAFDRRKVALITELIAWISTAGIVAVSWAGIEEIWPFYVLTTVTAVAATVTAAARSASIPRLLPAELLPSAAALGGLSMGLAVTVGPALAGVLVATVGYTWTYAIDVVLFSAAFLGIYTLPALRPEGEVHPPGLRSLLEGGRFVRDSPVIRTTFVSDLTAMTFGMPRALYPAIGALLVGGGAVSVGILTTAFAAGALLCGIFSGRARHVRWQGKALGWATALYGACISLFGLVLLIGTLAGVPVSAQIEDVNLPLLVAASIALAGAGAADNVTAIYRGTILQAAVPDHLRGRLQGVFIVVVTGGPRLGDLYVGVLALFAAFWFPPLLGGLVIIAVVGLIVRTNAAFRTYDALNPVA